MSFRLLTYNIRYGGAGREDALAAVVEACRPDLVVFQEATRPAVIERIAAATGMPHWGARPGLSLGYMSRGAILQAEWHRPRLSRHAFLELVPAAAAPRIFGVHLSAVHSAWTERRRAFELRALLRAIQAHQSGFHVLAGDFNTLAPGEVLDIRKLPLRLKPFVWLSGGRVRWRTIQIVLDTGYVDGYRVLQPESPGFTFPTWDPHVRLDFVFVPAVWQRHLSACEVVTAGPARMASDHLPLMAELSL